MTHMKYSGIYLFTFVLRISSALIYPPEFRVRLNE